MGKSLRVLCAMVALAVVGCADVEVPAPEPVAVRYVAAKVQGYSTDACRVNSSLMTESPFEEPSPLGFSGRDVVTAFNQRARGTLIWDSDQTETSIVLDVIQAPAEVTSSGDVPRYQGYCVPMLELRGVVILVRTMDGRLNEEIGADIVALSDGFGGIGAFFVVRASLSPSELRGSFVPPAALMREGDVATLSIDLSWSHDGSFRAYCADGMAISDDPSEACSTYPGRLRFQSRPENYFDNPTFVAHDALDIALARIELR